MCHKRDIGFHLCCLYEIAERVGLQNHPAAINLKEPYVFIYPVLFSFSLRCSCVHWDKILPTKTITQEIFVFALFGQALFECVSVCVSLHLLHIEYQNPHSSRKVGPFCWAPQIQRVMIGIRG